MNVEPNKHEIECLTWRAEHDGRINAWWEEQRHINTSIQRSIKQLDLEVNERISALGIRVSAIEKKIIWVVALTTLIAQLSMGYFFK